MPSSKEIRQHVLIEHRSNAIGIDVIVLYKQHTIFNTWFKDVSNSLVVLRGKVRSDRYPDEWYEFTTAAWFFQVVSRGSEKTRDELKDPTEWSSGKTFRKHFLKENFTRSIEKIKLLAQVIYAAVFHAFLGIRMFFLSLYVTLKNDTIDPDGCVCFAAVRLTDADAAAASHFVAFAPMSCIRVQ
jgi:hypothetical protein